MNAEGSLERRIGRALSAIDQELGGSEDTFVSPITGDPSTSGLQTTRRFLKALTAPDPEAQIVVVRRRQFWGTREVVFDISDPEQTGMTGGETK